MKRRELLRASAAFGLIATARSTARAAPAPAAPLKPPADGAVPVAFLVSDGAVIIDFCGPWEVFHDVQVNGRHDAFRLYTVADTTRPIRASGGMKIVPDYDFATAPNPKVIVVPAQSGANKAALEWLRRSSKAAHLTMSVCTGAFVLARTGLLAGKSATTHHNSFGEFAVAFPDVRLQRGARFVDDGNISSAGGLSSGIDLALHVVERYYGRETAKKTADAMEYQGQGWLDASSNSAYAKPPTPSAGLAVCPVCWMEVDPGSALQSVYRGSTYFFCMADHKQLFDSAPDRFVELAR
ncbi:MAG TPA: DJ-1/PfpI family protein [Gemmatimonadales bacterium]|nr:DJ-1/PfpI family protein [Gemmatimonadales bacterium]